MDTGQLAWQIDVELRAHGTAERAEKEKAYLKSELEHYGATMPAIVSVVKSFKPRYLELDHDELLALVRALWSVPVHEARMAAVEILEQNVTRLQPDDISDLERLLRESRTWALVDPLAASIVGPLLEANPGLNAELDRWSKDADFWLRRSALLALLGGLRRGEGDFERFSRYADSMLEEKEFFVRKAIGWVLRETGKKRPDMVYDWVLPRAGRASGVTLREAVKPLSQQQRTEVLAAR
jgi:3-methyladenine DNA glycosylase AlkD